MSIRPPPSHGPWPPPSLQCAYAGSPSRIGTHILPPARPQRGFPVAALRSPSLRRNAASARAFTEEQIRRTFCRSAANGDRDDRTRCLGVECQPHRGPSPPPAVRPAATACSAVAGHSGLPFPHRSRPARLRTFANAARAACSSPLLARPAPALARDVAFTFIAMGLRWVALDDWRAHLVAGAFAREAFPWRPIRRGPLHRNPASDRAFAERVDPPNVLPFSSERRLR